MFRKIVLIIVINSLIFSSVLLPKTAQAQTMSKVITNWLTDLGIFTSVTKGAAAAANAARAISVPTFDNVQYVQTQIVEPAKAAKETKDNIVQALFTMLFEVLRKRLLDMLVDQIITWIQGGGQPQFVTNWQQFLKDAAGAAIGDVVLETNAAFLCSPFKLQVQLSLLPVPQFSQRVECTLDDIVKNIEDFYNDFSKGGWKGWIELTEGGNNVYSVYLIALDEKYRIIGIENKEQEAEIARGNGFFSPKDCIWYDANGKPIDLEVDSETGRRYTSGYKDVWGTPSLPAKCQPSTDPNAEPFETVGGIPGPCYEKCISHTPGQTISDTVSDTMGGYRDTLNEQIGAFSAKAGPYSVYVQAILTALINRTFKEGYGLLFAQNEDIPNPESPVPPPPVDPGNNYENKVMASLLKTELDSIKETLECAGANCLLDQQKQNLAVLKLILSKYKEIDSILDQILDPNNNCSSSAKSWANSQKTAVANEMAKIEGEINSLEADIAKTLSWISQISVIIASIDAYFEKFAIWEAAYEAYGGIYDPNDPNDPVVLAQKNLDNAEDKVIAQTQALLTEINGSSTGTTFAALKAEASIAYIKVVNLAIALSIKRGVPSYPATGTLYARLEEAISIKVAADSYLSARLFAP